MANFSRTTAKQTDESELEVQRRMADHALRGVTASSYSADVLDNFERYAFQPTGYELAFHTISVGGHLKTLNPNWFSRLDVAITKILYFGTLFLAAVSILWVRRLHVRVQVVTILASLIAAALMTQPFVHVASPRYWPVFLPMLSLLAVGVRFRSDSARSSPVLRRIQVALAVGWVAVPVTLFTLAQL